MVFSMAMIDSFLTDFSRTSWITEEAWRIAYIKLQPGSAEPDPAVLYISRTEKDTVLCCNGIDSIEISGSTVEAVFNAVSEKMNYYNYWERRALIAVTRNKDQRKNYPLLSELFPDYSVKVLDPEGHILYHDGVETFETLDPRMIYLMRHTAVCHEVVQGERDLTVFYSAERYKKHILFGRISYADGIFLLFSIIEKDRPFTSVETHLAAMAQKIFSRAEYRATESRSTTKEEILLRLLNGEMCEQNLLSRFESEWGSSIREGAVLAVMELPQNDAFSKNAIISSVRRNIPSAFPMQHSGRILCLVPAESAQYRTQMRAVAESSELCAVISPVLHFWEQIRNAWRLAEYVLATCPKDSYLIDSSSYLWDYYLHCFRSVSGELLLHPDLLHLRSLKENRDNMLVETLTCYLANNCRMAQVAEELHIHLSTLKYRLARIQEIIGFDPHDYGARMAFLLSSDLMRSDERSKR